MAGVQGWALAAAVSNAGGLGSLPCATLDAATLRSELGALAAATRAPFAVNFFCHQPPTPDEERERAWRAALLPYYRELGVDPEGAAPRTARRPFDAEAADAVALLRPPVVSFHFGLPSEELLARVRAAGARIIASATTVQEALALERRGVDAVIAQGIEAGGHRGIFLGDDLSTQSPLAALLPALLKAVRVPVIAAGGIADARGVAQAVGQGAAAAQVGTAYLLTPEATTSAVHRAAIEGSGPLETAVTNLFTGRPARGIVNRLMRDLGPISALPPAYPLAAAALAPLRAAAEKLGKGDFTPLWAGEKVGRCRRVPAGELTRELAGAA